jgi:hypothetical protein
MVGSKRLHRLLAELHADAPKARDLAASEITDLIEAGQISENEFTTTVRALIDRAVAETDPVARESMFNALSSTSGLPVAAEVNWDPIAASLARLGADSLEHALLILGFSGDAKYRAIIERYLRSPNATIRSTAAEALAVLDAERKQRISRG